MLNKQAFCTIFFLTFFLTFSFAQSKTNFEFIGGLKLNNKDTEIISYKIVFNNNNGIIKGYSLTDLGGEHETKNLISGTYDKKNKILKFKEYDIVYTKSKFQKSSFCYVNFNGRLDLNASNAKINDKFVGLYKNESKCISGVIQLVAVEKVIKLVNKVNKKISTSKKIDSVTKAKFNPTKMLDSLNTNQLKENQTLSMFTKDKNIFFEIKDSGAEDGDMINIYVNKKLILENHVVKKVAKTLNVQTTGEATEIEVEALNEGKYPPNTADVIIRDSENELKTISKLKKGKKTKITIIKK